MNDRARQEGFLSEEAGGTVSLLERARETMERLGPRLDDLADGCVEVVEADDATGLVKLRIMGGRLH